MEDRFPFTSLHTSLDPLKDLFNADKDVARGIVLVSPT
jgi:hypothetical protein